MLPAILLAAAGLSAPPAVLVRYDVEEAIRALTPAGPRDRALAGTVTTMGQKARWDLTASHFPGVAARSALAERGRVVLLDAEASAATFVTAGEFEELFRPPAGHPGLSSDEIRDLSVSVERDGNGSPFDGTATERWAVRCAWTLVSAQPGRLVRVKNEVSGRIETLSGSSLEPTPFDELLRLFSARGEARESLEGELRKVTGLPVRVHLEAVSEALAETVGSGSGPGSVPAARATSTTTRTVSNLRKRAASEDDASLFAVPGSYRSVPLERLKKGGTPQP